MLLLQDTPETFYFAALIQYLFLPQLTLPIIFHVSYFLNYSCCLTTGYLSCSRMTTSSSYCIIQQQSILQARCGIKSLVSVGMSRDCAYVVM
jgi:hypothetical protein